LERINSSTVGDCEACPGAELPELVFAFNPASRLLSTFTMLAAEFAAPEVPAAEFAPNAPYWIIV
jgi:hypothetical protein